MPRLPRNANDRRRDAYLACALAGSGAASLVLEIAGARVLSPAFGSTIHVWAALISVTLASLAAGYAWGGAKAEAGANTRDFSRLLCGSGALVLASLAARGPVLWAVGGLGLYAGSVAAGALLFGPSLAALGMLAPIAVRVLARSPGSIGARVGSVYALTTMGGVAGALATGFLLLPALGLRAILASVGLGLAALGAWGLRLPPGPEEPAERSRSDEAASELSRAQMRFLLAAVFLAGTATLALEVSASAMIGSFYGSSVYSWAAVLALTLVALSAGYGAGGRLADARPALEAFCALLAALAAWTLISLRLRTPVLEGSVGLGVRGGVLAAASALFGPGLALSGALAPLAVRLSGGQLSGLSRRVGSLYALSSAGNVLGALLAGFWLIPRFGVIATLCGLCGLWVALATAGLLARRRWRWAPAVLAVGGACVAWSWPRARPATNVKLTREGFYGQIKVVDSAGRRYLLVNGAIQSTAALRDGESVLEYCHALEAAPLWSKPQSRALVIGLGAGNVPMMLSRGYGRVVDVAEIDPAIAWVAMAGFRYQPSGQLFLQDGRRFVSRSAGRYGLVIMDAFSGDSPPYHLYTLESFRAVRGALEPGGLFVMNFVGLRKAKPFPAWMAIYKTLSAAFPHVRVFSVQDEKWEVPNLLFFASEGDLGRLPDAAQARPLARADAAGMLSRELHPDSDQLARAPLLTDDYAPLESLHAGAALIWRAGMIASARPVLLY